MSILSTRACDRQKAPHTYMQLRSSRLQLDVRNLSLRRRHLVNAYEVKVGIGVIAGNTVWSMPERLECEVLQKVRYINTLFIPT